MSQKIRRCGRTTKVDVFNQQIGSDDGFFTGCVAQDGSVITNARNQRMSGGPGALPQGIDHTERDAAVVRLVLAEQRHLHMVEAAIGRHHADARVRTRGARAFEAIAVFEVVAHEAGVDQKTARTLVEIGAAIRKLQGAPLSEVPSTRLLILAGERVAEGLDLRAAVRTAIVQTLSDDPDVVRALGELVDAFVRP